MHASRFDVRVVDSAEMAITDWSSERRFLGPFAAAFAS